MNSSHFDDHGNAHMVDVSSKPVTARLATARAGISLAADTIEMIRRGEAAKGDVLGIARLAAIQATKLTQQLIPLCHAIPIESVSVEFEWADQAPQTDSGSPGASSQKTPLRTSERSDSSAQSDEATELPYSLACIVTVATTAKTGVEMEAMTGASVAALTIYDMIKSVDRTASIGPIELMRKSGGKSGTFRR